MVKKIIGTLLATFTMVKKVRPLNIMSPKTRAYVKIYNGQTKWMYFLIKDDALLEKYNTIWDKFSADIKK